MTILITYLLQSAIGIALFYLIYVLLLRNETFYKTNRIFLLAGLILSLGIPLFPVSYQSSIAPLDNSGFFTLAVDGAATGLENTSEIQQPGSIGLTFFTIIAWIYLAGITIFLVHLIWQTISVLKNLRNSDYKIIDGLKIIDQKTTTPFSFFHVIVVDFQKYSERELSNIIAHEKVHIRERHWVDLLLIELFVVLFWINPVVWLYQKAIKQNHEYLADQGVLLAGYSPGQYQALLINQLMGVKVLGFAHNLNFSLNKKRMEMMKKEKSPRVKKMKLLLALPVIALLVFAFAEREYTSPVGDENDSVTNQVVEKGKDVKVSGSVKNAKSEPLSGINIIVKGTTTGTISDQSGKFIIQADEDATLVFSFVGYKTQMRKISELDKSDAVITMQDEVYDILFPAPSDKKPVDSPPPPPKQPENSAEVFTIVESLPSYKGGSLDQLGRDIQMEAANILKLTQDRGVVKVGFTVSAEGKVVNPHVLESSKSKILDDSAIKIVQKLDNWSPGVQRGKPVKVNLSVPVKFE